MSGHESAGNVVAALVLAALAASIGTPVKDLPAPFDAAPMKVISDPQRGTNEIWIFGEDVDLTEYGSILERHHLPWVAVEVVDQHVTAVFVDDFLDPAWFDQ